MGRKSRQIGSSVFRFIRPFTGKKCDKNNNNSQVKLPKPIIGFHDEKYEQQPKPEQQEHTEITTQEHEQTTREHGQTAQEHGQTTKEHGQTTQEHEETTQEQQDEQEQKRHMNLQDKFDQHFKQCNGEQDDNAYGQQKQNGTRNKKNKEKKQKNKLHLKLFFRCLKNSLNTRRNIQILFDESYRYFWDLMFTETE